VDLNPKIIETNGDSRIVRLVDVFE